MSPTSTDPNTRLLWIGLRSVILGLLLCIAGCSSPSSDTENPPPNVLLVVIDTLRADYLGAYGSNPSISPHLDRLAGDSILFEQAYAQSSWTKTSIASLLTGVYPHRHGVFVEQNVAHGVLPEAAMTLAEHLRSQGYQTAAVSGNPHIRPELGFGQGFDTFIASEAWAANTTRTLTSEVRELLGSGNLEAPFFLMAHFLDPHDPHAAAPGCRRLDTTGIENQKVLNGNTFALSGEKALSSEQLQTGVKPTPEAELSALDLDHLRQLYRCEIRAVDTAIGKILAALPPGPSWIIVTSDHGEEFLEHGRLRHGYGLFNETVRVPLLIRAPEGHHAGQRAQHPVQLVDVVPTLLDQLGIAFEAEEIDGQVLFPFAPSAAPHRAFGATRFRNQDKAFLVSGHQKLIVDFSTGSWNLFDLRTDPGELRPEIDSNRARDLLGQIRELIAESSRHAWEGEAGGQISPEAAESLRALGYVSH